MFLLFGYFLSRNNEFQFCITEMSTNSPAVLIGITKSVCQCFIIENEKAKLAKKGKKMYAPNCLFYLRYLERVEGFLNTHFVKSIFISPPEFSRKERYCRSPGRESSWWRPITCKFNSTHRQRKARTSRSRIKPYNFSIFFLVVLNSLGILGGAWRITGKYSCSRIKTCSLSYYNHSNATKRKEVADKQTNRNFVGYRNYANLLC